MSAPTPVLASAAPRARSRTTRRTRVITTLVVLAIALLAVVIGGGLLRPAAQLTDLSAARQPPSWAHPLGTDWLGRDMFARTVVGLRLSLLVGLVAASVSAVIALLLAALAAALGRWADTAVSWLVDLFLAVPHLVLLILVAFAAGRGLRGVVVAVAVTHWPSLTRLLRAEARKVMSSDYVALSQALGKSRWWIARQHLGVHLIPHFTVGLVLLFPHAILHEASLSFLGLGLSPHEPAIGIILSDAMGYLSAGAWWLAVLPGLALFAVVKAVDVIGEGLRALHDPRTAHE